MAIEHQPSCNDAVEPELLPVSDARARLLAALVPIMDVERVPLASARGRVLAADLSSPVDVPSAANSAMDGYAIHASSIPDAGEATLTLIGTAWAGAPFDGSVTRGEAVRIFTGAVMPGGSDTVVIQEHVAAGGDDVRIDARVEVGRNVRHAGEDVAKGQQVFARGRRLEASDLGVIASLGIDSVEVCRPVKVAFFTTGDELRALEDHAGLPLPDGALFDSNRQVLRALLQRSDIESIDLGIVRDSVEATRQALVDAAQRADLIITSGGVSAGEADHVTRVFHELGDVAFWKIAMRPGRPLAFGHIGDAAFMGLPGNPVAVMVTYLQFALPAIRALQGSEQTDPLVLPARSLSALRKSPGRMEYQRGVMSVEDGELVVASTGKQGAGRLSSMSAANCLIVLETEQGSVAPGDRVGVQAFQGLLSA